MKDVKYGLYSANPDAERARLRRLKNRIRATTFSISSTDKAMFLKEIREKITPECSTALKT